VVVPFAFLPLLQRVATEMGELSQRPATPLHNLQAHAYR